MTATQAKSAISLTRTTDAAWVKRVLTHPDIYPNSSDDGSPSPDEFKPEVHSAVIWLEVTINRKRAGIWALVPSNSFCYEIHTALLPWCRGRLALNAAQELLRWVWENTKAVRVWTTVPVFNRPAMLFTRMSGLTEFGRNPMSFKKDGVLYDQVLLGTSRPQGGI